MDFYNPNTEFSDPVIIYQNDTFAIGFRYHTKLPEHYLNGRKRNFFYSDPFSSIKTFSEELNEIVIHHTGEYLPINSESIKFYYKDEKVVSKRCFGSDFLNLKIYKNSLVLLRGDLKTYSQYKRSHVDPHIIEWDRYPGLIHLGFVKKLLKRKIINLELP